MHDQNMRRRTRAVAGNLAALKAETAAKFVGPDEISQVPVAASRAYVDAARAACDRAVLWEVPGEGHNAFLDRTTRSWDLTLEAVLADDPWTG